MQKILIADSSDVLVQALSDLLSNTCNIQSCRDGREVLRQLRSFMPDLLILDLMIPELDGIQVLKLAKAAGVCPTVLAITRNTSSFVIDSLETLNVGYIMSLPCDIYAMAARIRELLAAKESSLSIDEYRRTEELLLMLHFPMKRKGCKYLIQIIPRAAREPGLSLTKVLYPETAKTFSGNAQQVERGIRAVVEDAWKNCDPSVWGLFFEADRHGMIPKPSNGTFIATIAKALVNTRKNSEKT